MAGAVTSLLGAPTLQEQGPHWPLRTLTCVRRLCSASSLVPFQLLCSLTAEARPRWVFPVAIAHHGVKSWFTQLGSGLACPLPEDSLRCLLRRADECLVMQQCLCPFTPEAHLTFSSDIISFFPCNISPLTYYISISFCLFSLPIQRTQWFIAALDIYVE